MNTDEARTFKPVLLAVDDDVDALTRVKLELDKRYGDDYRVVCESSVEASKLTSKPGCSGRSSG